LHGPPSHSPPPLLLVEPPLPVEPVLVPPLPVELALVVVPAEEGFFELHAPTRAVAIRATEE
jgi:hypothetical protein